MSKLTAKLMSAIAVVAVAGTALASSPVRAAPAETAAADCLAAPSGPTPKGGHWNYRLDRATKQKCWYVKTIGKQPAVAAAEPEAESEPRTMQPAVADARAELPPRQLPAPPQPSASGSVAPAPAAPPSAFQAPAPMAPLASAQPVAPPAAAAPTPVPAKDTARWTQASVWSDRGGASAGTAASEPAAAKPAAEPNVVAESSMFDLSGIDSSLWMMLGALAGALALVGLAVGAAIRLSRPVQLERDRFIDAPLPWDAEVEDRPQPVFGTRR